MEGMNEDSRKEYIQGKYLEWARVDYNKIKLVSFGEEA